MTTAKTKAKTNATTPQGARAAAINLQAHQDSTSVSISGFCNGGDTNACFSVSRPKQTMLRYWTIRLVVLIVILSLVYINGL
jgi:dienelactone hydrolase